jgi:CBS domain-containing protein
MTLVIATASWNTSRTRLVIMNCKFCGLQGLPRWEALMIVKSILSAKGRDVATIAPTATVAEATKMLAERKIGALVVTGAGGRIVGIISERDIVRALARVGAESLALPLTDVMTRKVVTCAPGDSVAVLMERMTAGKFRHLPVMDEGELVGIISIGDVVKYRLTELQFEQDAMRDYIQTA